MIGQWLIYNVRLSTPKISKAYDYQVTMVRVEIKTSAIKRKTFLFFIQFFM